MTQFENSPNLSPRPEVSLQLAIERIEAGLLDGAGLYIGYQHDGYREVTEADRSWVSGSFSVDELDPFATLIDGRMETEITYDATVIRDAREFGGLSMMLVRETDPGHFLQFDIYEDGRIYVPNERGLHASIAETDRGEELDPTQAERIRAQLTTAAGFGRPRF